jgi:hypothetical protein
VLSTQTVNQGATAVYSGSTPTKPSTPQFSYAFTGWDKTLTNITSSFSTTAQYTESTNGYTIIWQNHDGTTLETDNNVSYGTTPTYNGATPLRATTTQYTYTFTGWSPLVTSVTFNATYTAQFSSTTNAYTVTWQNYDGTILETDNNVSYGTTPTYDGATPTKPSSANYDFTFTEWSPEVVSVVGNTIYTAQFNQKLNYIPITTIQELNHIRNNLSGNYRLMNDIDLDNVEWTPIGSDAPFAGTLDGKDFTISNLKITTPQAYVGLFGYNLGTIKNLKLDNVNINIIDNQQIPFTAGAFIGANHGYIENLIGIGGSITIINGDSYVHLGGLVGRHFSQTINQEPTQIVNGLINQIHIDAKVRNSLDNVSSTVGGLIGYTNSVNLRNSRNEGNIIGIVETSNVGGLIGMGFFTYIEESFNKGNLTANKNVGGLIGWVQNTRIIKSFNLGKIEKTTSESSNMGGMIGYSAHDGSTHIIQSYNGASIIGESIIGGLIGFVYQTNIVSLINSYNSGTLEGLGYMVGGLIGMGFNSNISISNSYNQSTVKGTTYVGGIVGYLSNSSLNLFRSLSISEVISTLTNSSLGGLLSILPTEYFLEKSYYYGSIISNGIEVDGLTFGIKTTDLSTFNLAFFTTTLEWDTEIWDFTGLDIVNGVYPTLRNMPELPVEE